MSPITSRVGGTTCTALGAATCRTQRLATPFVLLHLSEIAPSRRNAAQRYVAARCNARNLELIEASPRQAIVPEMVAKYEYRDDSHEQEREGCEPILSVVYRCSDHLRTRRQR